MPSGIVLLVALGVGGAFFGGKKAYDETRDHVAKPVYHHVIKPTVCAVKKTTTLGHKSCAQGK